MPNANNPNSVALTPSGTTLGASATDTIVSKEFRVTAGGAKNLRVDIYVGKVTAAAGVSGKVQHSSGYNIWADAKGTGAITASTDKTVSAVDTATDILTVTGHGFATNQPIVFTSSAATPPPLLAGKLYFAIVVDANSIKVAEYKDGPSIDITGAGSGTITVCGARVFPITFQTTVAGDQTYLPLKSAGRITATTGAGDALQVADVVVLMDD